MENQDAMNQSPQQSQEPPRPVTPLPKTSESENPQEPNRQKWTRLLLLAALLFACVGLALICIWVPPPIPIPVRETVLVPQTIPVQVTRLVTSTTVISLPQTVVVPQTLVVSQTVIVPQTVVHTMPVTQMVIVTNTVIQVLPVTQTVISTLPICLPPATTPTPLSGTAEFLLNGRFEDGFGVDGVPNEWFAFNSGGERVAFSYHDDTWTAVTINCNSALIEIDTRQLSDTEPDRFAGIGQTVSGLQPGAHYQFTMVGAIRTSNGDRHTDDQSYHVEWGIDPGGGKDWRAVSNWNRAPWNHVYYYSSPIPLTGCAPCRYSVSITAPSSQLTLFIRLYKRWAIPANELLLNLDNVSLIGPK